MKNLTRRVLTLSFFVAISASAVLAQGRARVTADIPFDFSVSNKSMPAGKYIVQKHQTMSHLLQVQGWDSNKSAYVTTNDAVKTKRSEKTILVFRRYGSEYFLAQMWTAGESAGIEVPVSKSERQARKHAERNIALNVEEQEVITIVVV